MGLPNCKQSMLANTNNKSAHEKNDESKNVTEEYKVTYFHRNIGVLHNTSYRLHRKKSRNRVR